MQTRTQTHSHTQTHTHTQTYTQPLCIVGARRDSACRIVDPWNSLDAKPASFSSLNVFKNFLVQCDISNFVFYKYTLSGHLYFKCLNLYTTPRYLFIDFPNHIKPHKITLKFGGSEVMPGQYGYATNYRL